MDMVGRKPVGRPGAGEDATALRKTPRGPGVGGAKLTAGATRAFTTALCSNGPKYPNSAVYSSCMSGGDRDVFNKGDTTFCDKENFQLEIF